MKLKEWVILFIFIGMGILAVNLIGYNTSIATSFPGVVVLLSIAFLAVCIWKVIPLKLPVIIYCSLLGLLLASPISPISGFITESAEQIDFKAPLTMVGALAGISIGASIHQLKKLGWRMIIIALAVMASTFIGSVIIAQIVLSITGAI
ncbi:hypothetical protein HUG20_14795 [Salicibibacter cibi]|uniref:DUF340 domain-containing protein n=1 Tax=Salicibibacter cibi TaxID=2743001 RepID=A0A7T6ZCV0_9BACI|nr:hypothetical protein [Salicibibacter cibi]QQK81037.1 hypothetical protein HUG20_14795 [Salicibibacter cibi]